MNGRRVRVAAIAVVVGAALVPACGDDDGDDEAVTVMLDWSPNTHHIGLYVAQQRGWYDDAGIDVSIVEPGEGGVAQAVAAGRADIGVSFAEEVLPARASDVPIVSVATIIPHNDSSLMSLASAGITRPRDLEGKTYGGFGGPLETELIDRLVECDGGDPSAVEMVEVGDADYLTGMEQGLFDVVWVFGGWDVLRANEVAGVPVNEIRFEDHFDCIPDWYTPVLIASESAVTDRPDQLREFLDVTARGFEAAVDDPAAAANDFMAAVPEADRALVEASADYHATRFVDPAVGPWGTQNPDVWANFEAFAVESGLLSAPIDVTAAYTNDLLPSG